LFAFLEHHHQLSKIAASIRESGLDSASFSARYVVPESEIDAWLTKPQTPENVRVIGQFWRAFLVLEERADATLLTTAAEGRSPMPWANHALGRAALARRDKAAAAKHFYRESNAPGGNAADRLHAFQLWVDLEEWEALREGTVAHPKPVYAHIRHELAIHDHRWVVAAGWALVSIFMESRRAPLVLAAISALMWLIFSLTLGKAKEEKRWALYLAAFVLGVVSIVPTDMVIAIETQLGFTQKADAAADLVYYVAGVGVREELCKLLLFLPLIPWLKRRGSRPLEVLVSGAIVGLGFAAVENINYYLGLGRGVALTRFVTANFFHMALTAVCAKALYDLIALRKEAVAALNPIGVMIMVHGLYDFFLGTPIFDGAEYLSMAAFIVLAHYFFARVDEARGRPEPDMLLVRRFAQALGIVSASALVAASVEMGASAAFAELVLSFVSVLIIVIMFVRQTKHLSGFNV
jgi:RsiW-degrading membrane proteinase PrsW (M82 family)